MAWLRAAKVSGVIIGGVAASLLGRPRVTRDVDVLVFLESEAWADFLSLGARFGFKPRRPDATQFAHRVHVLLVHHQPSRVDVDIVFGSLPFEKELVARAKWINIGGVRIPLPLPEDLIVMKAVAHRPRDMADIESVLDAHPKLNIRRILRWAREFSSALDMPEILSDLEDILARRRKKKA